ncbi:MAG TPA: hypothetical protein VGN15_00545, partial [Ktedonobacteraceae bacterium]|nr:hypothetical protein [Ktedonobacteraceae bacterium]
MWYGLNFPVVSTFCKYYSIPVQFRQSEQYDRSRSEVAYGFSILKKLHVELCGTTKALPLFHFT